jgi:ppGpp synthetase/RelA/SpoT-type nucleotidyltranferase
MDITKEYTNLKKSYEDFLNEIKEAVAKMLLRHEIPVAFEISARIKELESIQEKYNRKKINIESITEFDDLIGVRIVLLFPEYKDQVVHLIEERFKLLDKSVPSSNPKIFDYSSTHLIVTMKDEWSTVINWEGHEGKRVEIQVRTLSEHIWAETSHSLFYKREENIPDIMKRDLSKLSALLEVVDEKMQSIKANVEKHFKYIGECSYEKILKMDLNPETFRRIMLHHSNNLYENSEKQNKILSSEIEANYNILTTDALNEILQKAMIVEYAYDSKQFIKEVIKILDAYKFEITESQESQSDLD